MLSVRQLVLYLASAFIQSEASRILAIFPTPSISHQVVFRPLILELVNRGHEIVLLTTDPIFKKGEGPSNLTEIDVHDISYQTWREEFLLTQVTKGTKDDLQDQMSVMMKLMTKVFEQQMATQEMQSIFKNKSTKFDLLLLEAFFSGLLGLTHVYKDAAVIQIGSFGPTNDNLRTTGAPIHPIVYPVPLQQKINDLSFWDKISEIRNFYRFEDIFAKFEKIMDNSLKGIFGEGVPPVNELYKTVDMVFLNVHPIWDSNRPVPPNVIYMGGLHQNPEKELPQDLQSYLDASKHGVVYISFGTNVEPSLLPPGKIQAMIDALSKLPYDVLWKWNQDELPGRTKNIKISKWLPQSDLLRHPKVKLFITQGGLQSTDEAITAGVPLLGMPMLGDQWFNVDMYVRHKIGLRVDMETMTEDKFGKAVETILGDRSYHDNVLRLRSIMRDQPQTPLERAAWWTEYVLRNKGAKHLRSPAASMPWTQYLELELVFYLLISLISIISILVFSVFYIYSTVFKHHKVSIKLKKS